MKGRPRMNKQFIKLAAIAFVFTACTNENTTVVAEEIETQEPAMTNGFGDIPSSKVLVLGTYHFNQENHYDELSEENQEQMARLLDTLAKFNPTKVVIEKEVRLDSLYNNFYQKYLNDESVLVKKPNEAFQVGYRLAKKLGHDRIYLFDDQTEFIGSLKDFTFNKLNEERVKDSVFVDKYMSDIKESFAARQKEFEALSLYDNLLMRNSPESNQWNAERMHLYETRIGIQDSWMGPDWLGRWYQRNLRMMANVMKVNNPGNDRILIVVGDNHKWVLDTLFGFNPEFEVVSSYELLK